MFANNFWAVQPTTIIHPSLSVLLDIQPLTSSASKLPALHMTTCCTATTHYTTLLT